MTKVFDFIVAAPATTAKRKEKGNVRELGMGNGTDTVLTVEFSATPLGCVLTLRGELIGTSINALEIQLDQIGRSERAHVIFDIAGLGRIDASGLAALREMDRSLSAVGGQLTIAGAKGEIARELGFAHLASNPEHTTVEAREERCRHGGLAQPTFRPSVGSM